MKKSALKGMLNDPFIVSSETSLDLILVREIKDWLQDKAQKSGEED